MVFLLMHFFLLTLSSMIEMSSETLDI